MNMTLDLLVHSLNVYVVDHSTCKVLAFKATGRLEIFKTVAYRNFKMKGEVKVQGQNNQATASSGKEIKTYNTVMKMIANVLFVIALLCNSKIN
jgi:hypothetical protein